MHHHLQSLSGPVMWMVILQSVSCGEGLKSIFTSVSHHVISPPFLMCSLLLPIGFILFFCMSVRFRVRLYLNDSRVPSAGCEKGASVSAGGDACIFPQQSSGLLSLPSSMFTCGVPGSVAGDTIQEASGSDDVAMNCQDQLRGGEHHQTTHSMVYSITFANMKQPGVSHKRLGFRI